ncbi:MAG: AmmeMemoRadiSam system radical SAM enzyme [Candidatus Hodarchaeota archaeon]
MRKEGLLYDSQLDGKVKCRTCAHECVIAPDKLGICGTRINSGGKCYSLIYGALTAEAVDPIEKKPLFHFYPGNPIYSISSVGCSFKCTNCQNYHISQAKGGKEDGIFFDVNGRAMPERYVSPGDLISRLKKRNCQLLAFTYNEPLIWLEYIIDVGKLAKENGIKVVLVSNGYTTQQALDLLLPYIDAANIDIKALDADFYKKVCKVPDFTPVLNTVEKLHNAGKSVEVTNLIIPGLNDSKKMLEKLCEWCKDTLGTEVPIHFSAYRPMFKMDIKSTPVETLVQARDIALNLGLKHVYVGNAYVPGSEDTLCPGCNAIVISRRGYSINEIHLNEDNSCANCGYSVNITGSARKGRFSFF